MKFKLGCASAVLMFLCFDAIYAGALKSSFTKDQSTIENKNEKSNSDNERPNIDDNEVSTDAVAPTPSANAQEKKQEAPQNASKKEIKRFVVTKFWQR